MHCISDIQREGIGTSLHCCSPSLSSLPTNVKKSFGKIKGRSQSFNPFIEHWDKVSLTYAGVTNMVKILH